MFSLFAAMLSQAMFKFVEKSDDPSVASREAVKEHIKKLYGGGMSQAAFDDFLEIDHSPLLLGLPLPALVPTARRHDQGHHRRLHGFCGRS
jgi:hypothetical protein